MTLIHLERCFAEMSEDARLFVFRNAYSTLRPTIEVPRNVAASG